MIYKILSYLKRGIFWGCTLFLFNGILADLTNPNMFYLIHENFTFHAIGFLLLGIAIGGSTIILESERLSNILKTVIHALISTCSFLIIGFAFGWIPYITLVFVLIAIVQFIVIYFALWTISYFYEKHQIDRINATLKKRDMAE